MKKLFKKAMTILLAMVILVGVNANMASAETKEVIIHVMDGQGWGSMNVYNWGDKGETAGVWPGSAMTAEADGWYVYTLETEVTLNLVFSAAGGSPQSSNVDGVAADAGEIWVVVGGEGGANDLGASTNEAVLYLEAQEGWPLAQASDDADSPVDASEDTIEATADVPKTGEVMAFAILFVVMASLSLAGYILLKKKELR